MFRSEKDDDFCREGPTSMVILGVEDNSVTDLESNIDFMDPSIEIKKTGRGRKDRKKKRKTKKHRNVSKNTSAIPVKEDTMPIGIVEEVARVLKIYGSSDDEKILHHRSSRKRFTTRAPSIGSEGLPIPSKPVLKKSSRDWNAPSLDQFFREEHQFEGWSHQNKNSNAKLEELEIRSQASKASRFSTFLEENKTVREILKHLFDKELRQSTSQRIRQRFSIKALEDEELPCVSDNITIFGDGRSLGGMESVGNQSMPFLGLNQEASSRMSWFQRRRASLLTSPTPFNPPLMPSPIQKSVFHEKIDLSGPSRPTDGNKAFGEKFSPNTSEEPELAMGVGDSQSNNLNPRKIPNQRSSISDVFGIMSFSNLNEESIEHGDFAPRRPSLFGIRLDNTDTTITVTNKNDLKYQSIKEKEDSVSKHEAINRSRNIGLRVSNLEPQSVQSPSKLANLEPTLQYTKTRSYETEVEENSDTVDELEGIIDDDVLLDEYIEELVAKEVNNHESLRNRNSSSNFSRSKDEKSCDSSLDQTRGSKCYSQVLQDDDQKGNVKDERDKKEGDQLNLLELLKDNLDKAPRTQKDLNGWFERNTDRKKTLTSVEDRSHYGEIESVAGYSLQESLHSRRSAMVSRGMKLDNDLLSVDELSHLDEYSDGMRRDSSRRSYSDRSFSDRSYSDRSYSDHSSDRSNSNRNFLHLESSDAERENLNEECNNGLIRDEYSDDLDLLPVEDNNSDVGNKSQPTSRDDTFDAKRYDIQSIPESHNRQEKDLSCDVVIAQLSTDNALPDEIESEECNTELMPQISDESTESQIPPVIPISDDTTVPSDHLAPLTIVNNEEIEPIMNFDPETFQPREIQVVEEKPMELKLDDQPVDEENTQGFKDFPRHDGTAFFRYRLQEWKESVEGGKSRVVTFDKVIIREHNLCPGDNPACSDSLPISLDWDHGPIRVWAIDDFEKVKYMFPIPEDAEGMARRLSWMERRELLIEVGGYSDRDIRLAEKAHSKILEEDRKQLAQGKNSNPGFFSRLFSGKQTQSQPIPEDDIDEKAHG